MTSARCDNRRFPWEVLLLLVLQLFGGIWWASGVNKDVSENAKDIQILDARVSASEDLKKDMAKVQNDIEWIKEWLEKSGRQ